METADQLIEDYLDRLKRAARVLPAGRRAELLAEIREHLDEARRDESVQSEADVRTLLDRTGPPEDIVAAASEGEPAGPPVSRPRPVLEIVAVVMLSIGSIVLPIVGWLAGVVMLWSSSLWRTREKVLGTLVVPGGVGGIILFAFVGVGGVVGCSTSTSEAGVVESTCDNHPVADVVRPVVFLAITLSALLVPFVLLHLARRRADGQAAGPDAVRPVQKVG